MTASWASSCASSGSDDHRDADQAVAAAHKSVAEGVDFVVGHSADALTPAFVLVAGDAADGALFTGTAPAPESEDAAALMAALQAAGYDRDEPLLLIKTAIHAWAQAVEQAGSLAVDAVSNAPRVGAFDTVYGRIGFDDKGEL